MWEEGPGKEDITQKWIIIVCEKCGERLYPIEYLDEEKCDKCI